MKSLHNRLTRIDAALSRPAGLSQVVIYDAETGASLTPVPAAGVIVWIPDNGRGDGIPTSAGMADGTFKGVRRAGDK
jgi:hypothetical protein